MPPRSHNQPLLVLLVMSLAIFGQTRAHHRGRRVSSTVVSREDSAFLDSASKPADDQNSREVHVNLDFNVNMLVNSNKEEAEDATNKLKTQVNSNKKVVTRVGGINLKKRVKKKSKKEHKRTVKRKKSEKKRKERAEMKRKQMQAQSYQSSDYE